MIKQRNATAIWSNGGKDGKGTLSTPSGALSNIPYTFSDRFEEGTGTNPEELIAAAHAGCFTMYLAIVVANAGMTIENIETKSNLTMEKQEIGWTITKIHLVVIAKLTNADEAKFNELVEESKKQCPVSRVLKADITVEAKLV